MRIVEATPGGVCKRFDLGLDTDLLPEGPWDGATWQQWVDAIKAKTDRKGKNLFMPLRCAITGQEHGPDLKDLLPLIGRERVLDRLKSAA